MRIFLKRSTRLAPLLLAACVGAGAPGPASAQSGYEVYLTAQQNADVPLREPATTFSCGDKIFAVVELSHADGRDGEHELQVTWRNPASEDQEITRYPFEIMNGYARIWAWLKLHRSGEASLVQFMNPSAGMEEFVGMWELRVRVDGKRIATRQFEVIC